MPDKHENNVNITAEPTVGVFWLFKRRLIIESVPVSQAEACEGFCNHPLSHEQCWSQLQRRGVVTAGVEYDEPPRGRVVYNAGTQQFLLLADRCILKNPELVKRILAVLDLPASTKTKSDSHYRCARCLSQRREESL
jgi:hypothetical protein